MEIIERDGEVEIASVPDFDLEKTFECGQCFRWNVETNGIYTGVAFAKVARLRREGKSIFISGSMEDFETIWLDYFDLGRDYAQIRKRLCTDPYMQLASEYGAGIRILNQDSWEALCSFIISQCNNISRIKNIINTLCREYGDRIEFGTDEFFTFPSAKRLAALDPEELEPLRCGYRAPYIIGAARAVTDGSLQLDSLSALSPQSAREALKKLPGVGDKVANCVMLYGLNMLDSFPLDVWMKRAVAENFPPDFDPIIFSPFAGIAQQYIFYYARSNKKKHAPRPIAKTNM